MLTASSRKWFYTCEMLREGKLWPVLTVTRHSLLWLTVPQPHWPEANDRVPPSHPPSLSSHLSIHLDPASLTQTAVTLTAQWTEWALSTWSVAFPLPCSSPYVLGEERTLSSTLLTTEALQNSTELWSSSLLRASRGEKERARRKRERPHRWVIKNPEPLVENETQRLGLPSSRRFTYSVSTWKVKR